MTTKTKINNEYGNCIVCGEELSKEDIDARVRQHARKGYCIPCIRKYKEDNKIKNKMNSKYKIINNDCVEEMKKIKESSIDIVITSPPYNLNIKYNTYSDNLERQEYLNWINDVFQNVCRTLKDDGSFFLNVGSSNKDPWIHMDVANIARQYFVLQNDIVWVKSIAIDNITHGHFKPINSERYVNHTYEHIFHFTKTGNVKINRKDIGVPYMDKSNLSRWESNNNVDRRCKGNCWYIPYKTVNNKKDKGYHPATFPEMLVENCIKLHGYNKDTHVMDPFSGTGTVLYVAKKLDINGIQYLENLDK